MPPRRYHVTKNVFVNVSREVPQEPINPLDVQVSNDEFRAAIHVLSYAMMAQKNRKVMSPINFNVDMTTTRVKGFTRMNSPKFLKSKVQEDPQDYY